MQPQTLLEFITVEDESELAYYLAYQLIHGEPGHYYGMDEMLKWKRLRRRNLEDHIDTLNEWIEAVRDGDVWRV